MSTEPRQPRTPEGESSLPPVLQNVKRWQIVVGAVVVVLIVFGLIVYGKFNGINSTGVEKETQLTAQYKDNENYLSNFRAGFYEQLGLAEAKSTKMDEVLTDAVKGRYEEGSTAAPEGGKLFSAIAEAYPEIKGLDIYDKVVNYVQAGREGYKNQQSKLLDELRSYDNWRHGDLLDKILIPIAGFPGEDLRVDVGNIHLTGSAAEAKMYDIVLLPEATEIYETGEDQIMTVPGTGTAGE